MRTRGTVRARKVRSHASPDQSVHAMIYRCVWNTQFKIDKKDIDMLNLPWLDAPNPYYPALKMKLYYEFMIVENLPKVSAWRKFKKEKQNKIL